jgi:hypothetical protein
VALLLACIGGAYSAILCKGHIARAEVVDSTALGATFASSGTDPINSSFDEPSGSAAIGINYRLPAAARWTITPLPTVGTGRHWLYIVADTPQFFAADGSVTVAVDSRTIGVIRARPARAAGGFRADTNQAPIQVPPAKTFGYRFELPDANVCARAACSVTARGTETFWHVFRVVVLAEKPRYLADAPP